MKKNREHRFAKELSHDWHTLKSLNAKDKLQFLWDYYKWRIIVCLCSVIVLANFAHMLWEGQKPCRLRACVVLNTEDDCSPWFYSFTKELQADGKPGAVDVNLDQPFDYDNRYYYVQEMEVQTTVAAQRMDLAVCGEDMYHFLLSLNACLPLDQNLSADLAAQLKDSGRLVFDTANLKEDENGNTDPADGIDGYYAADLSGTKFADRYNQTEEGEAPPLCCHHCQHRASRRLRGASSRADTIAYLHHFSAFVLKYDLVISMYSRT